MAEAAPVPPEIQAYYARGGETRRLFQSHGQIELARTQEIVERDLREGQHRNPTDKDYFTTAFFHRPEKLTREVSEAGLDLVDLLGVEGPAWLLPDLERRWADGAERERLLQAARAVEREPALLGIHPHLLAVARLGARETPVE